MPPTVTQAPASAVGSLPLTRSPELTCLPLPCAKLMPKTDAMALGESALTAGVLRPALTTPPEEMAGAVAEAGSFAMSVNVAFEGTPAAEAAMVNGPAEAPSVTVTEALPSLSVMAEVEDRVAAPDGLTVKVTTTPGTPAPVASVTCRESGVVSAEPVTPV